MTINYKFLALSFFSFCILLMPAAAQDLSKLKLATVNMQFALNASEPGKKSKALIEKSLQTKTDQFKKAEESILAIRREIDNGLLNATAKQAKLNELEKSQNDYLKNRQQADAELQDLEQKQTAKIFTELKQIVADYAKTNKYDLVMEFSLYSAMIYSNLNVTDITKEVVSLYNSKAK